jgi:hypothetical protein
MQNASKAGLPWHAIASQMEHWPWWVWPLISLALIDRVVPLGRRR